MNTTMLAQASFPFLITALVSLTAYSFYLKGKLKTKWFVAKKYGYGWTPSTVQGWLSIVLFLLTFLAGFMTSDADSHSASDTLISFFPNTIFCVILLILIAYNTGEKARWRWGK